MTGVGWFVTTVRSTAVTSVPQSVFGVEGHIVDDDGIWDEIHGTAELEIVEVRKRDQQSGLGEPCLNCEAWDGCKNQSALHEGQITSALWFSAEYRVPTPGGRGSLRRISSRLLFLMAVIRHKVSIQLSRWSIHLAWNAHDIG